MLRRKQALRWAIVLFFASLLLLTFLSNTIMGLSLPKVTVEKPEAGRLELTVSGEGFLQPAKIAQLYAEGDWTVESIVVGKGDRVKKGDPLVTFDTTRTERALQDAGTRYEQMELQLEKLKEQLKTIWQSDDAAAVDNMTRDIKSQQLDMEVQRRQIADMERQIAVGATLEATFDGIVTAIGVSEGESAGPGKPVVEIADDASGYSFEFSANRDDASALLVGEEVKVWLEETPRRSIPGVISEIEDGAEDGSLKRITIEAKEEGLKPGLKVSVTVSHDSEYAGLRIPKETIGSDSTGDYVFTVTEEDGPLGTAYYVRKTYLTVKDENEDTVVAEGLMPGDLVVTESSEPLDDGDRVRY